jgi:hypothetical protein
MLKSPEHEMNETPSNYHSYLIRFWRMDNAGRPVWRAALQEPGSDSEVRFESPEALWAYLATQLGLAKVERESDDESI